MEAVKEEDSEWRAVVAMVDRDPVRRDTPVGTISPDSVIIRKNDDGGSYKPLTPLDIERSPATRLVDAPSSSPQTTGHLFQFSSQSPHPPSTATSRVASSELTTSPAHEATDAPPNSSHTSLRHILCWRQLDPNDKSSSQYPVSIFCLTV
ncbi:unnamed protein product [Calicophoron daubneyi]|uniref:Uncharacterized protein n=1 Tax=Calicophoron daubneyi TaxID=300641 RepID=A0AAV2TD46_CALDB